MRILGFVLIFVFCIYLVCAEENYQLNVAAEYVAITWSFDNESLYVYDNLSLEINNSFAQLKKINNLSKDSLIKNFNRNNISASSEKKNYEREKTCDNLINKYWQTNQDGLNTSLNFTFNQKYDITKICFIQLASTTDPRWNVTNLSFLDSSFLINLSDAFIKDNKGKNIRPTQCFNFTAINTSFLQFNTISLYPGSRANKLSAGMTEIYVYPKLYNESAILETKEIEVDDLDFWSGYEINSEGWLNAYYSNDSGKNWYLINELINKTDKKIIVKFELISDGINESKIDEFELKYKAKEEVLDETNPSVEGLLPLNDSKFNVSDIIEISANVSDNDLQSVIVKIEFSNSSVLELEMNNLTYSNKFNISYLIPDLLGNYKFTIFANDSSGNLNNSESGNFTVLGINVVEETVHVSKSDGGSTPRWMQESHSEAIVEATPEIISENPPIEGSSPTKAETAEESVNVENKINEEEGLLPTGSAVKTTNSFFTNGYGVWILGGLVILGIGIKTLFVYLRR